MIDGLDTTMKFDLDQDPLPTLQVVNEPDRLWFWIWIGLFFGTMAVSLRTLAQVVIRRKRL